MKVRIASRGSALARWQAEHVRERLLATGAAADVEIVLVRTTGDRVTDVPLARIGGRGLFTREVDEAVLDGRADIAVHSLKDVPTRLETGLTLHAVLPRANPFDAFVPSPGAARTVAELPAGARIGTSALRRRAQLLERRPDLVVVDLRGNLDTRLAKLNGGDLDGALLAVAGLQRLGREEVIGEVLRPPEWLPAVGQGALAVVGGAGAAAVSLLDDAATRAATNAERTFLRRLEGGCQVPIGGYAEVDGEALWLRGLASSHDGRQVLRGERRGTTAKAAALGEALADDLLARGAADLLRGGQPDPDAPVPAAP